MLFKKLQAWQDRHSIGDAALARAVGCAHTTIRRAKRGEFFVSPQIKAAVQDATKGEIAFADWAAFEESVVRSPGVAA